jgi:hypothetical protein
MAGLEQQILAGALPLALDLQSRRHISVILVVLEVGGTHPSEPYLCCRPIPPCVDCVFFGANERNVVLAASAPTSFLNTFLEVELGKASASALNAAPRSSTLVLSVQNLVTHGERICPHKPRIFRGFEDCGRGEATLLQTTPALL